MIHTYITWDLFLFRLNNIIDATGASSYHGFLPVLVRSCIQHMTGKPLQNSCDISLIGKKTLKNFMDYYFNILLNFWTDPLLTPFPQKYATALFSFLYHLASYENGKCMLY